MSEGKVIISAREFTKQEIEDGIYIVNRYKKLSRTELAKTICEGIDWYSPNGNPKTDAGFKFLNYIEKEYNVKLPAKIDTGSSKSSKEAKITDRTLPKDKISGSLSEYMPIQLAIADTQEPRRLWNEFIQRYHDEKYKRPFGSHLRYFIISGDKLLGCLLFSASALALEDRDKWIGWDKETRLKNLYLVINNTRFLIFPWVEIRFLASHVLSLVKKRITNDWMRYYNYEPVLLETFIDISKYKGTCYKAANWEYVGRTKGRGRQDRYHNYLSSPKDIYMYPLKKDFRKYLNGEKDAIIGGDYDKF